MFHRRHKRAFSCGCFGVSETKNNNEGSERNPPRESVTEERVAEERVAEERGAEERGAEERGAEERGAEERGAEERGAEERVTEGEIKEEGEIQVIEDIPESVSRNVNKSKKKALYICDNYFFSHIQLNVIVILIFC